MVAIGRHDGHRDLFIHRRTACAVKAFAWLERVLGVETADHVGALHIVVVEVDEHLVADLGLEESTAARRGHR